MQLCPGVVAHNQVAPRWGSVGHRGAVRTYQPKPSRIDPVDQARINLDAILHAVGDGGTCLEASRVFVIIDRWVIVDKRVVAWGRGAGF